MTGMLPTRLSLVGRYVSLVPSLLRALGSDVFSPDGLHLRVPGSPSIRLSVLAGNVRMRAIIDAVARPGGTVVDVGANIGVIAAYAAKRVGHTGLVLAVEPAEDNLVVLRENVRANGLDQVRIVPMAAGRRRETREFYLRGDISAVNSLYPESCYASVSGVARVEVAPLDELVSGNVDLVKIDVEGAELEVLSGMPRLLEQPALTLAIEWHPELQRAAGHAPGALPRLLLDSGFMVYSVGHLSAAPLYASGIDALAARLLRARRPVELFCMRDIVARDPGRKGRAC